MPMARAIRNRLGPNCFACYLNLSKNIRLGFGFASNVCSSRKLLGTLAFEEVRTPNDSKKPYTATALVLHGLLGSGRNWRSFSRNLASYLSSHSPFSEWRLVLVDLRNHGRSADVQGLSPPHDLVNAAKDLANLVTSQGWAWPDVVIGHSLGGKITLQFAKSCASGDYGDSAMLPKQLWVLDSVPGVVNMEDSDREVEKVLNTLQSLPSPIPSRKWLVDHMLQLGFSKSLSQWVGSNLNESGDKSSWAFNLEGAIQMFNSYRQKDYWSLLENPPKGTEISIVRAENSDRWDPDTLDRLQSLSERAGGDGSGSKVSLHVLPSAGHWVHVDNPKGLLDIVAPRIASLGNTWSDSRLRED